MRNNPEQHEIHGAFLDILSGPTGDGGNKRAAGLKPLWKNDNSHAAAAWRHYNRWLNGERYDEESSFHALAHTAWRLLAIAYQELSDDGRLPGDPGHSVAGPHHPDFTWADHTPLIETDGAWT